MKALVVICSTSLEKRWGKGGPIFFNIESIT
jgi:hypothetical protein